MADDLVVGRAEASRRPDGRVFLSIDAWHEAVFDRLAEAMVPNLPTPLHTIVDEVDIDLRTAWERAGFTAGRREWEYLVSTDPRVAGRGAATDLGEVIVLPLGALPEEPLLQAYNMIRAEVGPDRMPVEITDCRGGAAIDPARYAVADRSGDIVGLLRIVSRRRHARIEFVAVRAGHRRRGIARALLTGVLDELHRSGIGTVSAYVDAGNTAAVALFDGLAGRRAGSNIELVLR
ncbi:GNAT family N-acetyltransferase [Nocardia aurantia]|uniref:GNAT family N-acetyltransferase n=1 Tax=Nocardia aurantia TaxID=2585199 RepID=UPI0029E7E2C8|nr:GNAT family N-acetyltransferase [Nocardia aurantia]